MWPKQIKDKALVACARHCCVCHKFCGINIELHHIKPVSEGGETDFDNCIPLCFDCHADAGHYNPKHPKGTKYSPSELRMHRDRWFSAMSQLSLRKKEESEISHAKEAYEGQVINLKGFVWRESFAGLPNYNSLEHDPKETYWMLILPSPITLMASGMEHGNTVEIKDIKKLQLLVDSEFYKDEQDIVLSDVTLKGKLFQSITGHHHGQALFEVLEVVEKHA